MRTLTKYKEFYEFLKERGPVFIDDIELIKRFGEVSSYFQELRIFGYPVANYSFNGCMHRNPETSNTPPSFTIYFLEAERNKAIELVCKKFPQILKYKGRNRQMGGLFRNIKT